MIARIRDAESPGCQRRNPAPSSERKLARTIRVTCIQFSSPITTMIVGTVGPRILASTISRNRDGMQSMASVRRMIRPSTQRP